MIKTTETPGCAKGILILSEDWQWEAERWTAPNAVEKKIKHWSVKKLEFCVVKLSIFILCFESKGVYTNHKYPNEIS